MKSILTVDIGTTSARAIVFDMKGKKIHSHQLECSPDFIDEIHVEQDPGTWIDTVSALLLNTGQYCKKNRIEVQALSLTSQRASLIPVDAEGKPVRTAIMWQDKRTAALCREMEPHNPEIFARTAMKLSPVFQGPKIKWFKKNQNDLYNATARIIVVIDLIIAWLTGNYVTDRSYASRTMLYDLNTGKWSPELMKLFGVTEDKLCQIIDQGSSAGGLLPSIASLTGLPEGIPVVSAGGDQQCAALGLGITEPGVVEANTGTGSFVIALSDKPVFDPQRRLFCNESAIPGKYIMEGAMLTTGTIYKWVCDQLYPEGTSFREMDREAGLSAQGSNGVMVLPHFRGSGAPYWNPDARGIFYNINLATKRGDISRAVLEGIAMEMSQNIGLMEELSGSIREISVAGGMTKSAFFNQLQADVFNCKIIRRSTEEATSAGAWISAAVFLGIFSSHKAAFETLNNSEADESYRPVKNTAKFYRELKVKKERLYQAMQKV